MKQNSHAISFGLFSGFLFALLSVFSWSAGVGSYVNFLWWYTWIPTIFIIILIGAFLKRKPLESFSFQEALKYAFLAYVIYELMYAITNYMLYNVIDVNLSKGVIEKTIEKTRTMMQNLGVKPDDIDKEIDKINRNNEDMTFMRVLLGFGQSLILDFIKAVIVALIVKKKPVADSSLIS